MAKKKNQTSEGEQMDLIDTHPKNEKEIIAAARAYKRIVTARLEIQKKEAELKDKLLGIVDKANLTPLEGGVVKFRVDNVEIKVTPRDKLVQVKELDPTE